MSWLERRLAYLFKRSSTVIPIGGLSQQESLDSLTTTLSFSLSSRPSLSVGNGVTAEWIDIDAGITRYQFGGSILSTDTESHPQATDVPCAGPLALLRNARRFSDGDLLLTGMTDGEVVEAVLTYCGISFDSDDIHEVGYVLGAQADGGDPEDAANIWWRAGEAGSTIVQELDNVFFFHTYEVGNGRILRQYWEATPSSTGLYRTYTRGSSRDLFSVHRRYGDPDRITNSVLVKGLSRDCGSDGSCQCTIYSKAIDANPRLAGRSGRGIARTTRNEFQSDLIQDEGAAEWRARQMMRRNNRLVDELALSALNDPNVHPGSVIGLVDRTTYIDADPRYYIVTTVDRDGYAMTLSAIGGAAGDEGTVTTGVEKICNRTESADSAPGDDLTPITDFPPLDDGLSFDIGDLEDLGDIGEITPPEEPDITTPFQDCTELDGMAGTGVTETGFLAMSAVDDGVWRASGASVAYHLAGLNGSDGVDEIVAYGGGAATIALNETTPYSSKLLSNDTTFPEGPALSLAFDVWFETDSAELQVSFGLGGIILYPAPGRAVTPIGETEIHVTAQLDTENTTGGEAGNEAEHICHHPSVDFNNGGLRHGSGLPLGTWVPVSVSFDFTAWPMNTYYAGQDGGYVRDFETCDPWPFPFDPAPCDHPTHRLEISMQTDVGSTLTTPTVKLRGLAVGHTTCVPNEDFDPSTLGGSEG